MRLALGREAVALVATGTLFAAGCGSSADVDGQGLDVGTCDCPGTDAVVGIVQDAYLGMTIKLPISGFTDGVIPCVGGWPVRYSLETLRPIPEPDVGVFDSPGTMVHRRLVQTCEGDRTGAGCDGHTESTEFVKTTLRLDRVTEDCLVGVILPHDEHDAAAFVATVCE